MCVQGFVDNIHIIHSYLLMMFHLLDYNSHLLHDVLKFCISSKVLYVIVVLSRVKGPRIIFTFTINSTFKTLI